MPDSLPSSQPGPPPTALPDRVRTPLLELITQQSLDEDYRHVADRAAREGAPTDGSHRRRLSLIAVAMFGVLLATAFAQTSRNASATENNRASLIERVKEARADVNQLHTQLSEIRETNALFEAELDAVAADERAAQSRLLRLQVSTGYVQVSGEGIRAVVDSAPDAAENEVLRDEDLAVLVDALWSAGAEAIAINGRRLTVLTQIRSSSAAIHVGDRPISPPYTVQAIGDQETLQGRLTESAHGREWFNLKSVLRFQWEIVNVDEQTLPAARPPLMRMARVKTEPEQLPNKQEEEETP